MIEVTISKTKLDEARSRERVKCLLYDVKPNSKQNVQAEMNLKKTTQKIYSQMGLSIFIEEMIHLCHIGSFCSYQLTEANSVATVHISSAYTCHKLYEITPKKRFLLEPEKTNFKHLKFHKMKSYTWRFYLCFLISCESWNLFSWAPIRNCLRCYYR